MHQKRHHDGEDIRLKTIIVTSNFKENRQLHEDLSQLDPISTVHSYVNKKDAYEAILMTKPELVFVDIKDELYNKWEFIERIRLDIPRSMIVIVAENHNFAIDAFKLCAFDYLIKPVGKYHLNNTVSNYFKVMNNEGICAKNGMIHAFKMLHFTEEKSSEIIQHHSWRTQKGKEIFGFLLHNRMKFVSKDIILDLFWPNSNKKNAMSQLYTIIYHIRKTIENLGFPIEIFNMEQFYMLDLNGLSFDVDVFRKRLQVNTPVNEKTLPRYIETIECYKGDYFAEEGYEWAKNERYRLRLHWMESVRKVANYYIRNQNYSEAIHLYLRMQEMYPTCEESYEKLVQLFYLFGDRASAQEQYHALSNMLYKNFKTVPRQEISTWYNRVIDQSVERKQKKILSK